ncbi:MAG: DNA primase, partial [Chloroflexi bacterium]|nr:DNA primase [Chloroflexota bacterium]
MALLDEVKLRLVIVEVVSHYVPLEQAGRNFKAHCPFHTERTPSFFVFPERQTWRCFGACASGGDALGFVMRAEGLGFGDALRLLAQRLGVKAPQGATATRENPLYEVNGQAASFYHQYLLTGPDADHARRFLEQRGVTENSLREFRLGLSPAGWDVLKKHLLSRGFSEALMLQAGLIHRAEDGRTRDLFRGRLMFPICEPQEKVAGFGGRSLDGSEPKYLNSPKTPIFDKGRLLYGLPLASDAIRLAAEAIVVEGYIDVVIAHQEGFRNVVASMGTALTDQQVGLLRGSAPSCVLALDPDTAGQEATFHSLEASWKVFSRPSHGYGTPGGTTVYERPSSVALKIAALPPGKDPDDLIRESRTLWETVIKGSTPLLEFLFFTLPTRYDLSTPQGKLQLAERLGALVIMVESSGEQDHYLQLLEQLLGVSRRDLSEVLGLARQRLLQRGKRPHPPKVEMAVTPFIQTLGDPLESYTLALLLQYP